LNRIWRLIEIDQLVVQPKTVLPSLFFLHGRRQRALNSGTDQAQQELTATIFHPV
jgi:hypothetical protein